MAGRGIGLLDLLQGDGQDLLKAVCRAGIGCPARRSVVKRRQMREKEGEGATTGDRHTQRPEGMG